MHRNYEFILKRLQNIATDVAFLQTHTRTCPHDDQGHIVKSLAEAIVEELGTLCDAAQFSGKLVNDGNGGFKVRG